MSPRCPDCGNGALSYRVQDEDTGCFYPLDDGEHFCRPCQCVWTDEDVGIEPLSDVVLSDLGDGWKRAAA